jgi:hypothetical protein
MNVQPSALFEAVIDTGQTGLVGTIGVRADDNLGSTVIGFIVGGISEIAPGVYSAPSLRAPATQGQYTLIWQQGVGGTVLGVEDLTVSPVAVSPVGAPSPTPPGGGAMSGSDLITEFLADKRFGTGRPRILGFLNYRYGELLGLEEWAFLQLTASFQIDTQQSLGPGNIAIAHELFLNESGREVTLLPEAEVAHYALGGIAPGTPEFFAVTGDGSIIVARPDRAYPAAELPLEPPRWRTTRQLPGHARMDASRARRRRAGVRRNWRTTRPAGRWRPASAHGRRDAPPPPPPAAPPSNRCPDPLAYR